MKATPFNSTQVVVKYLESIEDVEKVKYEKAHCFSGMHENVKYIFIKDTNKVVLFDDREKYLTWFNENVYPVDWNDEEIIIKAIWKDDELMYKNTLIILSLLRILFERVIDGDTYINLEIIKSVVEGEVETLADLINEYSEYEEYISNTEWHNRRMAYTHHIWNDWESLRSENTITKEDLVNKVFKQVSGFPEYMYESFDEIVY